MIGQAWSLVLWARAKRRILVVHFSEMLDSLAANLKAIQARKPIKRQYFMLSSKLLGPEYQRVLFLFDELLVRNGWPHRSRHNDSLP